MSKQWSTIHNKIAKLRTLAPWSIMISVEARADAVLMGKESMRSFNQFLTAEINRFKKAA